MVYGGFAAAVHAARAAEAKMIVMGADDDGLVCQRAIAFKHSDDIFRGNSAVALVYRLFAEEQKSGVIPAAAPAPIGG